MTIRIYFEKFEPVNILEPKEKVLAGLVAFGLELCQMEKLTGLSKPTVITWVRPKCFKLLDISNSLLILQWTSYSSHRPNSSTLFLNCTGRDASTRLKRECLKVPIGRFRKSHHWQRGDLWTFGAEWKWKITFWQVDKAGQHQAGWRIASASQKRIGCTGYLKCWTRVGYLTLGRVSQISKNKTRVYSQTWDKRH